MYQKKKRFNYISESPDGCVTCVNNDGLLTYLEGGVHVSVWGDQQIATIMWSFYRDKLSVIVTSKNSSGISSKTFRKKGHGGSHEEIYNERHAIWEAVIKKAIDHIVTNVNQDTKDHILKLIRNHYEWGSYN